MSPSGRKEPRWRLGRSGHLGRRVLGSDWNVRACQVVIRASVSPRLGEGDRGGFGWGCASLLWQESVLAPMEAGVGK